MRRKRSYISRRQRSAGPDFGRMYREKRNSRLPGFLLVLVLSVAVGVGSYAIADYNLDKKEEKQGTAEVTPEATATPGITVTPGVTAAPVLPETERYPDGFMSDFVDTRVWPDAKGVYVNTSFLGRGNYPTLDEIVELLDTTELNAMVIDIKDDTGNILFDSEQPLVNEIGAEVAYIGNLPEFVAKLKEHNIYCIARIVAFKDQVVTKKRPEMAVKNQNGTVFVDADGERWLNPYSKDAWEYLVGIAKEAAEAGFDEINFDYLRTSSSSALASADFGTIPEGMTRMDAITEFGKYACQ
ncbi:MAG: putative glycoside hydrolase, partial [Lachnospiraceae bacterium]